MTIGIGREPTVYDAEFPSSEADVENDVDLEFGLMLGRCQPMPSLYYGLFWPPRWWRTAMRDPNHE
jgi:hypothetical protein